jgi:LPXTG-motif cell wall-anchored protein
MAFEDMDLENNNVEMQPEEPEESPPPEEGGGNRTFLIVAGIIGAIMLLSLVCLALYALWYAPRQRDQQATQVASINAQNTQVAIAAEQTSQAAKITPTSTQPAVLPTSTPTPVVAAPTQGPPTPTIDRTATVAALLTEAAAGNLTATATALPDTGFADDVGIPGLVGLALLLIVVVFLARRFRMVGG